MVRIRHKKRGSVYDIVGDATIQCDQPLTDDAVVTIYREPFTGRLWVRPKDEMNDGRFEIVQTAFGSKSLTNGDKT